MYDHNKRSVYLMTQRLKRHPFLALFDGADPNATTAQRLATTVPTQALFFLNDPFVHAKAEQWADRLLAAGPDEQQRIEPAWRRAIGAVAHRDANAPRRPSSSPPIAPNWLRQQADNLRIACPRRLPAHAAWQQRIPACGLNRYEP